MEVEWPSFSLAASHMDIAAVIIHTSQMAFPLATMEKDGSGTVLPGPSQFSANREKAQEIIQPVGSILRPRWQEGEVRLQEDTVYEVITL